MSYLTSAFTTVVVLFTVVVTPVAHDVDTTTVCNSDLCIDATTLPATVSSGVR